MAWRHFLIPIFHLITCTHLSLVRRNRGSLENRAEGDEDPLSGLRPTFSISSTKTSYQSSFHLLVSQANPPGDKEEPGPVSHHSGPPHTEPLPRTGGTAAEVGLAGGIWEQVT